MNILECLVNLVFYAIIALAVLWVVSYVLSMFGFPGIWPNAQNPPASPIINLIYLLIGLILLSNFVICAWGGSGMHPLLPPIWTGH